MDIRELRRDELSAAQLTELTRLVDLVYPERLPDDPPMSKQLVYDYMSPGCERYRYRYFAGYDGERVIALGQAEGSVGAENDEVAEVTVAVDPEMRRRGLGSAMRDHVAEVVAADGRTRTWAWGPLDDDTRGFWEAGSGYSLAYDERISRCHLDRIDAAMMDSWVERASERAAGYHLERWEGACPDALIDRLADAYEAMNDAPLDDLEFVRERYDAARARDVEVLLASKGFTSRAVMAIETATGAFAGYTAAHIVDAEPALSHQGNTVTVPEHRNRGIGRWVKAEMWRWLRDDRPDVLTLDTGNAESNDAMLAINLAMGFEPVVNLGVWQRTDDQPAD